MTYSPFFIGVRVRVPRARAHNIVYGLDIGFSVADAVPARYTQGWLVSVERFGLSLSTVQNLD